MFDEGMENLALIVKSRPQWQAGKLNGPGGSVEAREEPGEAMRREFLEEAGVDYDGWIPLVRIYRDGDREIFFFVAYTNLVHEVKTLTDESVHVLPIDYVLSEKAMLASQNLRWIIHMAIDPCVGKGRFIDVEDVAGH